MGQAFTEVQPQACHTQAMNYHKFIQYMIAIWETVLLLAHVQTNFLLLFLTEDFGYGGPPPPHFGGRGGGGGYRGGGRGGRGGGGGYRGRGGGGDRGRGRGGPNRFR